MSLLLLSFAAGVLTLLSPCVLPVLPFVLARPGSGRLFAGLALGFGAVMLLATAGGTWAVQAHGIGRTFALALLGCFGLTLAWPRLASFAMQPLQSLGARIEEHGKRSQKTVDWTIGLSTGLLWAPCAGPVLGVVLTGAALHGGGIGTASLLLAYALGSAVTLGVVRWLVGRAGRRLPVGLLGALPWAGTVRRAGGVVVLLTVALIASGLDTRLAATLPGLGLDRIEQSWLDRWSPAAPEPAKPAARHPTGPLTSAPAVLWPEAPAPVMQRVAADATPTLPVLGQMPSLAGATDWLQSMPLGPSELRGKVVLVDFWTFGCVNCLHALPAVRKWAERYRDDGLVVIGVHSPELAFERDRHNLERALVRLDVKYPVAVDNDFAVWNTWSNRYWPTLYLVDAQGRVRWRHIGEGAYAETEQAIRHLLDEARRLQPPHGT